MISRGVPAPRDPILVLDDSPTMARTLALALEAAGYVVESRDDLGSALEWLGSTQHVAAIVVDNNSTANWASAIAKQARQGTPIVALLDPTETSDGLLSSFQTVQKPFDTAALLSVLESVVSDAEKKPGVGAWFKRLFKREK